MPIQRFGQALCWLAIGSWVPPPRQWLGIDLHQFSLKSMHFVGVLVKLIPGNNEVQNDSDSKDYRNSAGDLGTYGADCDLGVRRSATGRNLGEQSGNGLAPNRGGDAVGRGTVRLCIGMHIRC